MYFGEYPLVNFTSQLWMNLRFLVPIFIFVNIRSSTQCLKIKRFQCWLHSSFTVYYWKINRLQTTFFWHNDKTPQWWMLENQLITSSGPMRNYPSQHHLFYKVAVVNNLSLYKYPETYVNRIINVLNSEILLLITTKFFFEFLMNIMTSLSRISHQNEIIFLWYRTIHQQHILFFT